jgi:hypothetical protein
LNFSLIKHLNGSMLFLSMLEKTVTRILGWVLLIQSKETAEAIELILFNGKLFGMLIARLFAIVSDIFVFELIIEKNFFN